MRHPAIENARGIRCCPLHRNQRGLLMSSLSNKRYAVAAALSVLATHAVAQGPPTANVNVLNTPLQVTVTNPTTALSVTISNPAVRFSKQFFNTGFGETVIPKDTVPAGQKLIVAYANVSGLSNISGTPITEAGCQLRLLTTGEGGSNINAPFGALPMVVDKLGASTSQVMFLPLSIGEGLALSCFSNLAAAQVSWRVSLGGYFVPSP